MTDFQIINMLTSLGYKVSLICEVMKISRSTYYRHKKENLPVRVTEKQLLREAKTNEIVELIKKIRSAHFFWGYRRIWGFLKNKLRICVSKNRVHRLMKKHSLLVEVKRYKAKRTVTRDKPRADRINQFWGTDMTKFYVQSTGWVYLVVVIDWYTKKIIGYSVGLRSKTEDWIKAIDNAIITACPKGAREYGISLISDNGSQPTSNKYENVLKLLHIDHITTSYNNPKGNADTERFMRTFKEEIIYPNEFDNYEDAVKSIDNFIDFYNNDYPHSSLGYLSPVKFEESINAVLSA